MIKQKISLVGLRQLVVNPGVDDKTVVEAYFNLNLEGLGSRMTEAHIQAAQSYIRNKRPEAMELISKEIVRRMRRKKW